MVSLSDAKWGRAKRSILFVGDTALYNILYLLKLPSAVQAIARHRRHQQPHRRPSTHPALYLSRFTTGALLSFLHCQLGAGHRCQATNNCITALPPFISLLLPQELPSAVEAIASSVRVIDATNNRIASLPPYLPSLTTLQRLVLSKNALSALPVELGALASLKVGAAPPLAVLIWHAPAAGAVQGRAGRKTQ